MRLLDSIIGVAASPGLMRRDAADRMLQTLHEPQVFHRHGLGGYDQQLMSREWCVRYVNARRYVERRLNAELQSLSLRMATLFPNSRIAYPVIELPPAP